MTAFRIGVAAVLALAQAPVMATTLIDGGFEAKGAALPVNSYCYDTANAGDGFCTASPWVNLASNTGVIRSGNGAWGGVAAAEGSYYGFIQVAGVLAQSFTATSNSIGTVSWIDTNRGGYSPNNYAVSLVSGMTSVALGSFTTVAGPWVARTSASFALTNGASYSLRFTALSTVDTTSFIDNVALTTTDVPEPASWALLITGFSLTGAAMRRRRAAIA